MDNPVEDKLESKEEGDKQPDETPVVEEKPDETPAVEEEATPVVESPSDAAVESTEQLAAPAAATTVPDEMVKSPKQEENVPTPVAAVEVASPAGERKPSVIQAPKRKKSSEEEIVVKPQESKDAPTVASPSIETPLIQASPTSDSITEGPKSENNANIPASASTTSLPQESAKTNATSPTPSKTGGGGLIAQRMAALKSSESQESIPKKEGPTPSKGPSVKSLAANVQSSAAADAPPRKPEVESKPLPSASPKSPQPKQGGPAESATKRTEAESSSQARVGVKALASKMVVEEAAEVPMEDAAHKRGSVAQAQTITLKERMAKLQEEEAKIAASKASAAAASANPGAAIDRTKLSSLESTLSKGPQPLPAERRANALQSALVEAYGDVDVAASLTVEPVQRPVEPPKEPEKKHKVFAGARAIFPMASTPPVVKPAAPTSPAPAQVMNGTEAVTSPSPSTDSINPQPLTNSTSDLRRPASPPQSNENGATGLASSQSTESISSAPKKIPAMGFRLPGLGPIATSPSTDTLASKKNDMAATANSANTMPADPESPRSHGDDDAEDDESAALTHSQLLRPKVTRGKKKSSGGSKAPKPTQFAEEHGPITPGSNRFTVSVNTSPETNAHRNNFVFVSTKPPEPEPLEEKPLPEDEADQTKYQQFLTKGATFLKHGRSGAPHNKIVYCTSDPNATLCWCDVGKRPRLVHQVGGKSIKLSTVTSVIKGKQTAPFKRAPALPAPESFCFSVVCRDRSLDLQAQSEAERDEWVTALTWAVKVCKK